MPGLAHREKKMRHAWNALRTILVCALTIGVLAMNALAAPGDQPSPTDKFKNLEFREIGPAVMGGRIDDFAVVESNPSIVYVGTASGGVWKTTNNGTTWEPVFDKQSVSTIGDIAIAPSDPAVVWVGTGEPNNRQSSSWGDGAYKSLDAGKTWKKMVGLEATRHIGRIVIHPRNPDVVYVAALGHLWGANPERGVYKTTDGGKTWSQVLKINDNTGVSDIAMDPESPDTLYAAAYERRRTPYGFNGGGPDAAIYKTTDGGATWKKLTKGLPYENGGDTGRIGLDIYRKDPNVVFALVQHEKGGIFRSDDKGETWKRMSDTNPRPSYYSQVRIDPNNDLRIWSLGAQMFYSEDGGKTFSTQRVRGIHGDYHAMWIDPADSNHMITGSDGGIHWSYDAGKTWDFLNTIAIGQFYEVSLDNEKPYHICGGLQDNGSWCGPSQTLTRDGIVNEDWHVIHGGDGFYAAIDNVEPWIVYTESQDGFIDRRDLRTGQQRSIKPEAKAGDPHYRFQWNSPVAISAFEHTTVYYGGNYLFKSMDRGDTWTRLGGDLTTAMDRNKLQIFGKTPDKTTLSRHDGVQEYPTITTLSESPLTSNVLWVGTDDGNVQVSRDGGKSWKNVASKVPGVPKGTYVSRVTASKTGEGAALLSFDGHRSDDYAVYLFSTSDYGETWKAIRSGIPDAGGSVHVVREHPRNMNLLFAGTEFGLWVSWDRGTNSHRENGCHRGCVTLDVLPAAHGHHLAHNQSPLERWPENVHREKPGVWRALELLPEGRCATRSAEERQRPKGQEKRRRREGQNGHRGQRRRRREEGRQSKNHRARQRWKSTARIRWPRRGWRQPYKLGFTLQCPRGADTSATGSRCGRLRLWPARSTRRARRVYRQDQSGRQGSLAKSHC